MSHIEVILPYGLPAASRAADLVPRLRTPVLASLLSHSTKSSHRHDLNIVARALPHEAWLACKFGLTDSMRVDNSPPFAGIAMQLHGVAQRDGFWFLLHPCHLFISHDRMAMADTQSLALSDAESRQLFDAAKPCFDESGKTLLYGNAKTWFIRADDWKGLQTATPDIASNRNLANWMPTGSHELAWRKLLNEVQMMWHVHPLNAARSQRGEMPVNSLWLWGGASSSVPDFRARMPYSAAFRFSGMMAPYGGLLQQKFPEGTFADVLATGPKHGLVLLDHLASPAMHSDWQKWLSLYESLEVEWFAPMIAALRQRKIDRISLHVDHDSAFSSFTLDRSSLRKFWLRKSLIGLLS